MQGFRSRDAGRVEVLGYDPGDRTAGRALRERIGLVLQDIAVEPYLTVRETLARNAGYYPAPRDVSEVIMFDDMSEILPGGRVFPQRRPAHVGFPSRSENARRKGNAYGSREPAQTGPTRPKTRRGSQARGDTAWPSSPTPAACMSTT
jgi:hypothetical protein